MTYTIFDDRLTENFYPLTLNRSTGDLRVGILKLRQRITAYLEIADTNLIIPTRLAPLYKERHPKRRINCLSDGDTIFINSRLKISDEWVTKIRSIPPNTAITEKDSVLIARCETTEQQISSETIEEIFNNLESKEIDQNSCWEYTWQLISSNSEYIERDFADFFYDKDNYFETEPGVTILNPYNVWIGEGTEFKPGVVIDASNGPVVIDEGVKILPNAVIIGPVFIGKKSLIKASAKIYEGTSIGPVCKIGGEIETSIFQAYSNKQHDGFLGHSYIGEWVNLGADTNNSDLKNNYKMIKSYLYPLRRKYDTGNRFLGVVIGDHTKTGINCSINTGTVIGIGCNLYGQDLISDFIPSFCWGKASELIPYRIESFLQTAATVKERREISLTDTEKSLFVEIQINEKNQQVNRAPNHS